MEKIAIRTENDIFIGDILTVGDVKKSELKFCIKTQTTAIIKGDTLIFDCDLIDGYNKENKLDTKLLVTNIRRIKSEVEIFKENRIKEVATELEILKGNLKIFNAYKEAFKEYEGKKINKRIETKLKNMNWLQGTSIYYYKKDWPNSLEITMYNNSIGVEYDNKLCLRLVADSQDVFNYDKFIKMNQYYFTLEEKIKEYEHDLYTLQNTDIVEKYFTHKKALEEIRNTFNGSCKYDFKTI